MNKYRNQKTIINGIKFDSKLEAKRYQELKLLERANEIESLELQPEFELIPSFKKNGKTIRRTIYKGDFSYIDKRTGKRIIEDTKGYKTKDYILKKKMFEYKFPELTIKEVNK
jgi:hypothetical protein